jgi:hypothetical protein
MTEAQRKRISIDYAVMYTFPRRIAAYQTPERLRRSSEKEWGLPYDEALEMAYDNVLQEAKGALKQVRKPFVGKTETATAATGKD